MKTKEPSISALKKFVRATNYLAVAQIYLRDNELLEKPLEHKHIKARLLGHWGTCPGINFTYAHINRIIQKWNQRMLFVVGPGHGFPAIQANLFLEKTLSQYFPKAIPYNKEGLHDVCSKFSAPFGYPSHANPGAPGSILEGGELGYSLSVAYGSVLDNPDLITCCLVGDGESETGPLSASWNINKILSPEENGAVLPIIHLNGYKISGPTFLGRMSNKEIQKLYQGHGYDPYFVEAGSGDEYKKMAKVMDICIKKIRKIQERARSGKDVEKPEWPMIIMRTPKGWTGTKEYNGTKLEGNCSSHQVILKNAISNDSHLRELEKWMKSYKFNDLIEKEGKQFQFDKDIRSVIPPKGMSCGTQKYGFGGEMIKKIQHPKWSSLSVKFKKRGEEKVSSMRKCGTYLTELFRLNQSRNNVRVFCPDETYSNRIDEVFTQTKRSWQWPLEKWDKDLARNGKVMEMLSEQPLFGLAHGYSVTGRFGAFVSYESFAQVAVSMADQYVKFLKASKEFDFRKPIPALNVILTSLLERQDHNGFSHQNPSFLANMLEKDGEIIHAYLPPDANCMLPTMEEAFSSFDKLNTIIAGKQLARVWLSTTEAKKQMKDGMLEWDFASDKTPQIVLAGCGDYATNEALASIKLIKELHPKAKIRFVGISKLSEKGLGDSEKTNDKFLDSYFTKTKKVIINFHGYRGTLKKLLFDYSGASRIKINGYKEEGSTTSPFDMQIRNETSRYHLVMDMAKALLDQKNIQKAKYEEICTEMKKRLQAHKRYIIKNGDDPENITNWTWE